MLENCCGILNKKKMGESEIELRENKEDLRPTFPHKITCDISYKARNMR